MTITTVAMLLAAASIVTVVVLAVFIIRDRRGDATNPMAEMAGKVDGIEQSLSQQQENLDRALDQLNDRVLGLQKTVDQREGALGQQVGQIDTQVRAIADAFTNDRARGGWAELTLRRMFELGGLTEGRDFQMQFAAGERVPDAVITLPGERKIVVDSKFPLARFNDARAETNVEQRAKLMKEHAKELERVGNVLRGKCYAEISSGGYVVMYLPSQAVWEAAVEADSGLVERLLRKRVIVAGPASLFALLLTAGTLLAEQRFVGEAQAVLADARELHKRLAKFTGFFGDVGTHLGRTVNAYNSAVGSWTGRLAPHIGRMAERASLEAPPEVTPLDTSIRELPDDSMPVAG